MNKEDFYDECARLLNTEYDFVDVIPNNARSGRWGPRKPGNGRYPGIGLIRWFSENYIHVSITGRKEINAIFRSPAEVFEVLKN